MIAATRKIVIYQQSAATAGRLEARVLRDPDGARVELVAQMTQDLGAVDLRR